MVEIIRKQAVFSGMKVSGNLLTQSVPGPFTVEVCPNSTKKGYTAYLLPTRQRFGQINTRKIEQAEQAVSGLFEKVEKPWEVVQ
jgi:hypothetical protein